MNNLKKIIKLVIFMFVLLSINLINVFALDAKISFSDPSTKVGEEFNVKMKVTSLDGMKLGNVDIILSYDDSKIEFISAEAVSGGAGSLKVNALASASTEWEYNLKFKAISGGEAKINLSSEEVYDSDGRIATISHKGSSIIKIEGEVTEETLEESESIQEETESITEESTEVLEDDSLYTKLSVNGKTVSIIDVPLGIEIPNGLSESIIEVNGTRVKAWLDANSENKEYVVVYAKNDNDEAGFYSYDLTEKTIQRYFAGNSIKKIEDKYNKLLKKFKIFSYILCIFIILFIILLVIFTYLFKGSRKKKVTNLDYKDRVARRIQRNKDLLRELKENKLEIELDDDFSEVK